jgi:hypothetical protein
MSEARLVIVALLVVGLTIAMGGPPPRVRHPFEAALLGLMACGLYLVAAAVAIGVSVRAGTVLLAPGVLVFCFSCWLSRGADRGGGGGGGGNDGRGPEPEPPIDWEEFDRLRAQWSRQPVGIS